MLARAGRASRSRPVRGTLPGTGRRPLPALRAVRSELHRGDAPGDRRRGPAPVRLAAASSGTISLPANVHGARRAVRCTVGSRTYQVSLAARQRLPVGRAAHRAAGAGAARSPARGASAAQTRTAVLGRVGERIYEAEADSPIVARDGAADGERPRPSSPPSRTTTRPPPAPAILGFFAAHIHVVRVRVTGRTGKLLVDVGGPYALAPVHGTLRSGGQRRRALLLRDPGRRRLHEARAAVHRRRGADADRRASR